MRRRFFYFTQDTRQVDGKKNNKTSTSGEENESFVRKKWKWLSLLLQLLSFSLNECASCTRVVAPPHSIQCVSLSLSLSLPLIPTELHSAAIDSPLSVSLSPFSPSSLLQSPTVPFVFSYITSLLHQWLPKPTIITKLFTSPKTHYRLRDRQGTGVSHFGYTHP